MTPERFHTIVDAYGADPRRWPDDEREAATAWAALHPHEGDAVLAASADIDAWLDSQTVAPPDYALQQCVVASAPARRPLRIHRRMWWSGAAIAGVGLAGGLAGAFAVSFFLVTGEPPPAHELSWLTTSFGGSSADWSGE
ncbi:hypothetical protein [Paraburkholderia saeva]|uniref:Uncharacterized protein n=1 Tax=Paraburkholderia saeva TaxID=2777537 RepID=A0A9N8RSN9_9BURK|nr:hypothetical protein [Paraburkholderia saeva]CAG4887886.1 hypothetical protein LMG31841_00538 [Paraburkholderia saeva]